MLEIKISRTRKLKIEPNPGSKFVVPFSRTSQVFSWFTYKNFDLKSLMKFEYLLRKFEKPPILQNLSFFAGDRRKYKI